MGDGSYLHFVWHTEIHAPHGGGVGVGLRARAAVGSGTRGTGISLSEVARHLVLTGDGLLDWPYKGELLLHRLSDRGDICL
jgi:hypothetical protein